MEIFSPSKPKFLTEEMGTWVPFLFSVNEIIHISRGQAHEDCRAVGSLCINYLCNPELSFSVRQRDLQY